MSRHRRLLSAGLSLLLVGLGATVQAQQAWTQWGGDNNRSFQVPETSLGEKPALERVWTRDLGGGYSGMLFEADRLYTHYREGDDEVVVCLDSETGETIWETRYAAPIPEEADTSFGKGPNATPLLTGDRLVTVGFLGDMHCLDKQTGKILWKTSLWKEHAATPLGFGFSASPIEYAGNLILPVGGKGQTLKAFRIDDGTVAWSSLDYDNSYGTLLLTNVDGIDQLVLSLTENVIGIDPSSGAEMWSFPMKNQWDTHAFVPVWDASNQTLFVSSFRQSHGLKLNRVDDKIGYEKLWSIDKTGIGFTNAVQIGDVVYGTTGGTSSPIMTAFDLKQGEVLWKERGFGISNFLAVGDRLLLLDEKGNLAIADPDDEGLNVTFEERVLESEKGWTFPTLVGNRLFVRNQKQAAAWILK